jgi:hypothetical protein
MFTIKVIEGSTGKPAKSQRVCVGFDGILRGMTKEEYTDANGEVHFDYDNGEGDVFINGRKAFNGKIEGRVIIYT